MSGLVLNAICFNILLGSSIELVRILSGAFQYCCSFCISPLLYNSSIMFDATVTVSVWPDSFHPNKSSNLVQISIMLDGTIISTILLPVLLVSKVKILLTSLIRSSVIYL